MSLKSLKPRERVQAWPSSSAGERINNCIAMLFLHGFISEGEKNKARDRFAKWARMHTANPEAK